MSLIIARRKFRDVHDAIVSLSIAADLDGVVNDKLFDLQKICASGLASTTVAGIPKFALTKPTGSKRRQVLSALSLMEQWSELYKPLVTNAKMAAKMPKTLSSITGGGEKDIEKKAKPPAKLTAEAVGNYIAGLKPKDFLKLVSHGPAKGSIKALFRSEFLSTKGATGGDANDADSGKKKGVDALAATLKALDLDTILCAKPWEDRAAELSSQVQSLTQQLETATVSVTKQKEEIEVSAFDIVRLCVVYRWYCWFWTVPMPVAYVVEVDVILFGSDTQQTLSFRFELPAHNAAMLQRVPWSFCCALSLQRH